MKKLLILLLFTGSLYSQDSFKDYSNDFKDGFNNAFFDKPAWLGFAGGIALASKLDHPVKEKFTNKYLNNTTSKIFDIYGFGGNFFIAEGYILTDSWANNYHGSKTWNRAKIMGEAYAANLAVTFVLKHICRRQRPGKQDYHSFPSGHTSTSFVVAATLQQIYGNSVGIPAYIIASLTGYQRIYDNKHWLSDVLTGALLGTLIGNGFGELYKDKYKNVENVQNPALLKISITF